MDEFADAVSGVRNRILNQSTIDVSSQALAYMTSDVRLSEAEIVSRASRASFSERSGPPNKASRSADTRDS